MASAIASTFVDVYKTTVNEFGVGDRRERAQYRPPGAADSKKSCSSCRVDDTPCGGPCDAAKRGLLPFLRDLVQREGAQTLAGRDEAGHTPAHWACLHGHLPVLEFIIEQGEFFHLQSHHEMGQYPLHWACVNGHVPCIEALLTAGVDINARDAKGCTPLITACQYGQTVSAGFLIGRGALVACSDSEGDTPLHWAGFKGQADLSRLLVYAGCEPQAVDNFGQTPLHLAAIGGNISCVRDLCLVDKVDLNIADRNGKTPLMLAAGRQHEFVETFLKEEIRSRASLLGSSLKWRHLIFGPPGATRTPMLFFLICVIVWGYPTYIFKAVPLTYEMYPTLHWFFLACNAAMWICFYHSNMRDPGYLPRNIPEYDAAIKQAGNNAVKIGLGKVGNPLERLCHTCRTVKPLRAKHCRVCNRCVLQMDHHCPYIYNCVGVNNRLWFGILTCFMMMNGVMTFAFAYLCLRAGGFDASIVAGVFIAIFGMIAGGIVCSCVWYHAATNLTTNESMNQRRYTYLQDSKGKFSNPFDRGIIINLLEFCHIKSSRYAAETAEITLQV